MGSKQSVGQQDNFYESVQALDEYLLMHYGLREDFVQDRKAHPLEALDFPKRCADQCVKFTNQAPDLGKIRALDLGCAVGGSTFELARHFEEVVGIDYSQSFVDACNDLKKTGKKDYKMLTEGHLTEDRTATIDKDIKRDRCTFQQGDACNLDLEKLGEFGVVLGANLVCRLPEPKDFLRDCAKLVKKGGYLVLPSPYSWLQAYTPKEKWLGGYKKEDGTAVKTFDTLKEEFKATFDLVYEEDMPFVIRETARKNQLTWSHCTVWKRKA